MYIYMYLRVESPTKANSDHSDGDGEVLWNETNI